MNQTNWSIQFQNSEDTKQKSYLKNVLDIETCTDFVRWINDEQGENEDICLLLRRQLERRAD
jgi:hypothetical protein